MAGSSLEEEFAALVPEGGFTLVGLQDDGAFVAMSEVVKAHEAENEAVCGRIVDSLTGLTTGRDLQTHIALRLLAENVDWPPYERGDGYWSEPSDNAVALVRLGGCLSSEQIDIARSVMALPLRGVAFLALGLATNPNMPRDVILGLALMPDPVIAAASTHDSLEVKDVQDLLSRVDNGVWVSTWIRGLDGWTWPDWQYAFQEATGGFGQSSAAFWEALLLGCASPSRWPWIDDFIQDLEDGESEIHDLDGLLEVLSERPDLVSVAASSGWSIAMAGAATVSEDEDLLRKLASFDIPMVREAIMDNENASDEIRAFVRLSS
jgi:hypothetical protein